MQAIFIVDRSIIHCILNQNFLEVYYVFFTLLFIISVIMVFSNSDFEARNIIGFSILVIYISLMLFILIRSVYKKSIPSTVKITSGIISILIGFLMSYSILTNHNIDELLII